jgi:amino acid adenylation domain-containing protein
MFQAQVRRTPDAVAIAYGQRTITYDQLNRQANRIAHYLKSLGVRPDQRIALCAGRTPEMVAGLLAILKAGGAYVPLDLSYPASRLRFMLEDSGAVAVLSDRADHVLAQGRTTGQDVPWIPVEAQDRSWDAFPDTDPDPDATGLRADHLAYVIYTSGSTGSPKGVMVEHRQLVNHTLWFNQAFAIGEADTVLQRTPFSFDASVWEFFSTLTSGACLKLSQAPTVGDTAALARELRDGVSVVQFTPTLLKAMLSARAFEQTPALRIVFCGGEMLAATTACEMRAQSPARLVNLYGPTEATIDSTSYEFTGMPAPHSGALPIGSAIANAALLILRQDGTPTRPGEAGEICIGGAGVARGYLNQPGLTADKFIENPVDPGGRLYRTGDLGRLLPDGSVACEGRVDFQIKVNGFRIEPGEIEACLSSHPDIEEVVVVARTDDGTGDRLVAYIIGRAEPASLRAHAADRLPSHMIPAAFVRLAGFPALPNGKLDRMALPPPGAEAFATVTYEPACGPIETALVRIWSDLLGICKLGRSDNFLQLGGHSLLAARVAHAIAHRLGRRVDAISILRTPVLSEQARLVGAAPPWCPQEAASCEPRTGPALCTFAQRRYWTLERLLPGSPRYNIPLAFKVPEHVGAARLEKALEAVVSQHPILRTTYSDLSGELCQTIRPVPDSLLVREEVSGADPGQVWEEAVHRASVFAARGFDLEHEIPLRALLICPSNRGDRLLAIVTHHIALDGSIDLFIETLSRALSDRTGETAEPEQAKESPHYIDFAFWERRQAGSAGQCLDYWAARLQGAPSQTDLPFDRVARGAPTGQGGQVRLRAPDGLLTQLDRLCISSEASRFQVLLATTWACLAKLSSTNDLCVAAPVSERRDPAFGETLGCFVNTVILRGDLSGDPQFDRLLDQARERTLEAIEHGAVPIEEVVAACHLRHGAGAFAANVMVSLVDRLPDLRIDETALARVDLELPSSRFDLGFFPKITADGLELMVEYDGQLFERTSAERLARCWLEMTAAAIRNPELRISELPLLTPEERHQLLETWNDTAREHEVVVPIHSLFEERARLQPAAIAIWSPERPVTYGILHQRMVRLAARILALGVPSGSRVAILCDRTPDLIAAMLAVVKAGCAYVPIDPASPPARREAMLRIADARLLLTDAVFLEEARDLIERSKGAVRLLPVCGDELSFAEPTEEAAACQALPDVDVDSLAYVIFTSGTTGMPKAVAVRHRQAFNLIDWVNRTFDVGPHDRLLFVTSVAFDLSVYDVFGVLGAGGSLRIASGAEVRDPGALAQILESEPITFWDSAPIVLEQCAGYLENKQAGSLRLVFLSGDWVPVTLPSRIRASAPGCRVIALGGATEAVVWSNYYEVGEVHSSQPSIPYGKPIQNARYHVLDEALEPVPIGVAGDLYIGGDVLAQGYLGNPALTAERFVPDPFRHRPDARLYRTGDRARYMLDGNLEFLGRLDGQVKIRGFRVELQEVETVLASLEGVREAHVIARGERHEKALVAYVVPKSMQDEQVTAWRARLRELLPEHMVPGYFVQMSALPLNANGKIDRARLPHPRSEPPKAAAGPLSDLEEMVAGVWENVLQCSVRVDVNFFDLGGNSAGLVRIHRQIEEILQRKLPIVQLFRFTTIRELSAWLGQHGKAEAVAPPSPMILDRVRRLQNAAKSRRLPPSPS